MAKRKLSLTSFPNSFDQPLEITSPDTGNYNCIAWALDETALNYWPSPDAFFAWNPRLAREETVEAFILFFKGYGYEVCENGRLEKGYQKIALFAKDGLPTHTARQLTGKKWTSKLGILEDVRHTLNAISGGIYGEVVVFMKKKL
jgi:hypothetical protein